MCTRLNWVYCAHFTTTTISMLTNFLFLSATIYSQLKTGICYCKLIIGFSFQQLQFICLFKFIYNLQSSITFSSLSNLLNANWNPSIINDKWCANYENSWIWNFHNCLFWFDHNGFFVKWCLWWWSIECEICAQINWRMVRNVSKSVRVYST